jgi:hypothetical protein
MMLAWLTLFNTLVAPVVGAILKLLFQLKIIKSEADVAETQRRFEAAMKAADKSKADPIDAQRQYDGAKKAVEDKWKQKFGGGQG